MLLLFAGFHKAFGLECRIAIILKPGPQPRWSRWTQFCNAFLLVFAALFRSSSDRGCATVPRTDAVLRRCREEHSGPACGRQQLFPCGWFSIYRLHVLEFFGISLPVVRVAGGLVVTAFGWKLLNAEPGLRNSGWCTRKDKDANLIRSIP